MKSKYIILLFVSYFVLTASECKKTEPTVDNPPEINNYSPSSLVLEKAIGDTVDFSINAIDADDDPISYRTLVNDEPVNNSNNYRFIVPDLGTFRIQMDAYNDETDSQMWTVNVENEAPVISSIYNVTKQEDTIEIGSIAKTFNVNDDNDSLDDLVIELSQTNESLIKFGLDNDNNIVIEDYTEDGNGSSEVTIKVTDSHGAVSEESFTYNITPMTDIEGKILDSDTWEPNTALQGFAIIEGDTVYADATGKYKTQITPAMSIDIEAGYRSLDKLNPMSFITTARGVLVGNDVSDADIMVVTYLNNNMTPEEFRTLGWETNFRIGGNMEYVGAKVPSTYLKEYLVWENHTGDVFTQAEMDDIKQTINDSINVHLKNPPQQIEINYFDPQTESERRDVTRWAKNTNSNPSIGTLDYDSNGTVDFVTITSRGDESSNGSGPYYEGFISNLLEEGYGAKGEFMPVSDPNLEGKTIAYEFKATEWVKPADIKFIKLIEGIGYQVGYLVPKMPIDDVLKIQQ